MSDLQLNGLQADALQRRRRHGRWLVGIAIALFATSALMLADAGYGHDPHRTFGQRRAYDTVRRDVRRALPRVLAIGLIGILSLRFGLRSLAGTATSDE